MSTTEQQSKLQLVYTIFCDDVRLEVGNKLSLMGVFHQIVVQQFPVTILKFALFYLEGYQNGQCSGSSCTVTGRFINAQITTGAIAAGYDSSAAVQFVKLIE